MSLYDYPVISADSHITEHPDTYLKYIDAAWRDKAPRIERGKRGDEFVIEGLDQAIPMGVVAAAGKKPEEIVEAGTFDELHRSGWDPTGRVADQQRDGVSAEVLYLPSG